MKTIRDTAFEYALRYWSLDPPTPCMLVVMKATYSLTEGRVASLSEKQDPCIEETLNDGSAQTVRYESDFTVLKPRAEALLMGSCHASEDEPLTQTIASFKVGEIGKSFAVFGDRYWNWKRNVSIDLRHDLPQI